MGYSRWLDGQLRQIADELKRRLRAVPHQDGPLVPPEDALPAEQVEWLRWQAAGAAAPYRAGALTEQELMIEMIRQRLRHSSAYAQP